jgi:hypothetical protein
MRKTVFDPHVPASERHRFTGIHNALSSDASFRLLSGHYPYGVHRLYSIDHPRYFVMLREPIERATSNYFFIKGCSNASYIHPRLDDVESSDLSDLYRIPEYQNLQTRFIAGLGWEYMGRHIDLNGWIGQKALERAKYNLTHRYTAFGLKERFRDSAQLFARRADMEVRLAEKHHKKTPNRPSLSDLSEATTDLLRRRNSLDMALYQFAVEHFEVQFDE